MTELCPSSRVRMVPHLTMTRQGRNTLSSAGTFPDPATIPLRLHASNPHTSDTRPGTPQTAAALIGS